MRTTVRCLIFFMLLFGVTFAEEWKVVPRTIIALYNGELNHEIRYFDIHQFCAMPLEYLGARVEYYDMSQQLPDIKNDPEVIGVLVGNFHSLGDESVKRYFDWAIEAMDAGKKFVVVGVSSNVFYEDLENQFWRRLGLKAEKKWIQEVYDTVFTHKDLLLVGYERDYSKMVPSYRVMTILSEETVPYLSIMRKEKLDTESCLIAIGENGGYIADGYGLYSVQEGERWFRSWYINPFIFFNKAFGLDHLPKADTTTLAGRRVYYSHIDGDGWNNRTLISSGRADNLLSSEVIYDEILLNWPNLPVTVGAIAADLDPVWVGFPRSQEVAKKIYSLPNVEVSSHTYSHPFDWKFFENYTPQKEEPYLPLYEFGNWRDGTLFEHVKEAFDFRGSDAEKLENSEFSYKGSGGLKSGYTIPRAYANEVFNIDQEVNGSIREVAKYIPSEKKAMLVQWSGDCEPFQTALELAEKAKVGNINGGDTRYDSRYPSVSYISPLSRTVGGFRQIYASMANENIYTDLWTNKFYNFNQVVYTWKNTEVPFRLKPMNHYFHMYSGEKRASLNALLSNIEFIESQTLIPLRTSRFIDIVKGFYTLKLYQGENDRWKVVNKGELQTLRFDGAMYKAVDFSRSEGVIGQNHLHGSLYVYCDLGKEESILALKEIAVIDREPVETLPYLVGSSWRVWDFYRDGEKEWSFKAKGFGDLEMVWSVPSDGEYIVELDSGGKKVERRFLSKNHLLEVEVPSLSNELTAINIRARR